MNYYTDITAERSLECSLEEALELMKTLNSGEPTKIDEGGALTATHSDSGLSAEYCPKQKEIYFFAEDYGDTSFIPDGFIVRLGALLAKLELPHLEFGVAFSGDKHDPGSHGGTYFRITADGRMIDPELIWPKTKLHRKTAKKANKRNKSK